MDISLRGDLEKFLNECVQNGRYQSREDALNAALQLLKEAQEAEGRLEMLLEEAEESGPATEMTAQDWIDIENEGLKQLRERKSA